jgi:excisionase family DNA binding protein
MAMVSKAPRHSQKPSSPADKDCANTATQNPLVRAEKVAKHFDVHTRTVCLWADRGEIPCIRVGGALRFDFEAVLAAVKGGRK